ncbi:DNA-processing protein DprA [Panacagrimonas sp.]|uniref:DNA-processing protein DprA n=1 Tax=Panacagrimonas sp. TaxID=2480088 RepID=UPI003B52A74F
MPPEELRGWLRLIRSPGLGAKALLALIERFGSAAAAVDAGRGGWKSCGVGVESWDAQQALDGERIERDLQWCLQERCGLLTCADARYPARLREIAHFPPALFWRGDPDLLALPQLAVVGSRNATPQGVESADGFAAELTRRGLVVTSGLALGIDAAAHRGALRAQGLTVAVCATGLDRVYPAAHRELAQQIEGSGLLISEFPPGTSPRPEHFPRRNRLISGLSLGVLVVEAARESGSLITARLAAEQGREVFAIPGSIHNVMARGCHQLIRQGAKLVETVDDILEEIGDQVGAWLRDAVPVPARSGSAPHRLQAVLDALGDKPSAIDELVDRLDMGVEDLNAALLELELEGLVASAGGGRVMRLGKAPARR